MKKFIFIILSFLILSTPSYSSQLKDITIDGVEFEHRIINDFVYKVKAEKAWFGSKKIGFLNFGLIKVLYLKDVTLIKYDKNNIVEERHFDNAYFDLSSKSLYDNNGDLIFKG